MNGKVCVVTGATSGIGKAAATALARLGATVVLVGRDRDRTETAAAEIGKVSASPPRAEIADLASLAQVRGLAERLAGLERIDVLINNAGLVLRERRVTPDGFEHAFALNHLAPFLLTNLLRDCLTGGRVVTTASDAHHQGRLDLEDLQSERSYSAFRVYGTTKLCNILFTRELARRAPELHATCFHPGAVRTGFGKNENGIWKLLTTVAGPFMRSPERGARSLVWLALSDEAGDLNGVYVDDEKVSTASPAASDDMLARALWERSAELVGVPADRPA
jgi:NAD(P)-dependent dehydrogenase (short-subunit alcohol dehydrogenase family)